MARVLLVEDSCDVLYALRIDLELRGYEVVAVTDASAALSSIQHTWPDVIVSDLRMPWMDGFEFISRIRQIPGLAAVPAIALTGTSRDVDVQHALACGFTAHLTKPVDGGELEKRIELLTSGRLERKAG
jgi:two-component system, chemotaxis family, CheB/CheR fusion protein